MKRLTPFIAGAATGVALATICTTKNCGHNSNYSQTIINDTVINTVTDTIFDTLRLTTIKPVKMRPAGTKRITAIDSLGDTNRIDIPVKQHVFEDDSAKWRAVVTGSFVTLDTMQITQPTLRHKIFVKQNTSQKWHIGPAIGIGYNGHKISPYIGITLTYSLISH